MILKIQFRGQMSPIMSAVRMGTEVMRVSIDIPLTERENALPLLALMDQPLIFEVSVDHSPVSTRIERLEDTTIADEIPKDKPKKEPSAFGYYWSYLFKQGFLNDLDLQEALLSDAAGAHAALRKAFGVEHLSISVAPAMFEQWIREKGLKESFITMSKNAQVYHLEKQGKG